MGAKANNCACCESCGGGSSLSAFPHLYRYVDNDPLNNTDPYGEYAIVITGEVAFLAALLIIAAFLDAIRKLQEQMKTPGFCPGKFEIPPITIPSNIPIPTIPGFIPNLIPIVIPILIPPSLPPVIQPPTISQSNSLPVAGGPPNGTLDKPHGKQTRAYGPNGEANWDIDRAHPSESWPNNIDHVHEWIDGVRQTSQPPVQPINGNGPFSPIGNR